MQLDAPSAAPGWPVESRSVCPVLCGAFRAVFFRGASLPMVSRLGGGLMERLVSRGAARRSKNVVAVALVALAFPPPGTTSASPAIPVSGNSHGRPWGHSVASGDCCPGGAVRPLQSSIRAALQRRRTLQRRSRCRLAVWRRCRGGRRCRAAVQQRCIGGRCRLKPCVCLHKADRSGAHSGRAWCWLDPACRIPPAAQRGAVAGY